MDAPFAGRVLALDLATSTGWACGSLREGVVGFGVLKLPRTGDDLGWFLDHFECWLGTMIEQENAREIVYESPILPGIGNLTTLRKLYGLAGSTEKVVYRYRHCGLRCFEANLSEIRPPFIGARIAPKEIKGKAERRAWLKRRTVLECRRRGYHVAGDDEADALALLSLRLSQHQSGYDMRAQAARAA